MGYLNVFTPFAELYHYESISRGLDTDGAKAARYNEESAKFRENGNSCWRKGILITILTLHWIKVTILYGFSVL